MPWSQTLFKHHFFLRCSLSQKVASLCSVKHCSITSHSYFCCNSAHWSLQSQKYLPKCQIFHYRQYSFVASTRAVAFLFLGTSFYTNSFVLRSKTLIHPKKPSKVQLMYFVQQATHYCQCWISSHCFFSLTTHSKPSSLK